jgi:hypothetical protein
MKLLRSVKQSTRVNTMTDPDTREDLSNLSKEQNKFTQRSTGNLNAFQEDS